MDALERYSRWLSSEHIDEATKQELLALEGQVEEINDRFSKQLMFGTGGLRGVVGAGINRMNVYTVRFATQAYANFLRKNDLGDNGVVLACDSRRMSQEFMEEAATVLVGNSIPVYLFSRISPTPLLSFGVRFCNADGGIMITASHNPAEYNGYKAYCSNGIQLLPEPSNEITALMEDLSFDDLKLLPDAKNSTLWHWIDDEVYQAYYEAVDKLAPKRGDHDLSLKTLFTPLHGTGGEFVPQVLKNAGFNNVDCVAEQLDPDGDFPTVVVPNPEEVASFELAFKQAEKGNYDIILATDPDADRVGVAVWDGKRYTLLNGNQVGVLLTDYLLQTLPKEQLTKGVLIKTVVTTEMVVPLAKDYGVQVIDTLTGFKFIGSQIEHLLKQGKNFVFGFEESCGYLAGDFVRDKDGVIASLLIVQMAAYYKNQGMTILQRLAELMEKYGYYIESLKSYSFSGLGEAERVDNFIAGLREEKLTDIGGLPVKFFKDYWEGLAFDFQLGRVETLDFPQENVLQWETAVGDRITLRPSGTEPKMKLYVAIVDDNLELANVKLEMLEQASDKIISQGLGLDGK